MTSGHSYGWKNLHTHASQPLGGRLESLLAHSSLWDLLGSHLDYLHGQRLLSMSRKVQRF